MYKPMIHIHHQLNRTHNRTGIFFSSCSLIRCVYVCLLLSPSDPIAVSFHLFPYFVIAVVVVVIIVNVVDDFSLSSQRQNINQKKKEFCTHKYIMEATLLYKKSSPLFEIKLSVRCFVCCYSCCLFLVSPLHTCRHRCVYSIYYIYIL